MRLNSKNRLSQPFMPISRTALSCLLFCPVLYMALHMAVAGSRFSQEGRIQLVGVRLGAPRGSAGTRAGFVGAAAARVPAAQPAGHRCHQASRSHWLQLGTRGQSFMLQLTHRRSSLFVLCQECITYSSPLLYLSCLNSCLVCYESSSIFCVCSNKANLGSTDGCISWGSYSTLWSAIAKSLLLLASSPSRKAHLLPLQ